MAANLFGWSMFPKLIPSKEVEEGKLVPSCKYSNKMQFNRGWLSVRGSYWLFPALGGAKVKYTGSVSHLVGDILQRIALITMVTWLNIFIFVISDNVQTCKIEQTCKW